MAQLDLFPPEPMKDIGEAKPVSEQKKLSGIEEATSKEKKQAAIDKINAELDSKIEKRREEKAKKDLETDEFKKKNQQRPMISPGGNVFKGATAKDYTPQETAIARKAENQEFKDKRVKPSPLVVEAELAKMRELTAPKSKSSGGGGGGGGSGMPKTGLNKKPEFKSGGKVSSASKRADGCAIRGKTRA